VRLSHLPGLGPSNHGGLNGELQDPSPWSDRRVRIKQSKMGGLTDREVTVRLHSKLSLGWTEPPVPQVLTSSMYPAASDMVDFEEMVSKPYTRLLKHICVQSVGSGCYHGGGLFQNEAIKRPQFILPSVFHWPLSWCSQSLTPTERWVVYDVPWSITTLETALPDEVRNTTWNRLLPAGHCLEYGLRHLLKRFGVMDGGYYLPSNEKSK
jgi:hypothetical protein